eukprot:40786-Prymnesium_polylepis.1
MATLGGVIPARGRWIRSDAISRRSPGTVRGGKAIAYRLTVREYAAVRGSPRQSARQSAQGRGRPRQVAKGRGLCA